MTSDQRKNGARRFAADAFFHLLELPQRDSHADTLPAATRLQKQKRRDKFSSRRVEGCRSMSAPILVLILILPIRSAGR